MSTKYTIYCTWEEKINGFEIRNSEFHFRKRSVDKIIKVIQSFPVTYASITVQRCKWGIETSREIGITLNEKQIKEIQSGSHVFRNTLLDIESGRLNNGHR
jgi:hypothetical protein